MRPISLLLTAAAVIGAVTAQDALVNEPSAAGRSNVVERSAEQVTADVEPSPSSSSSHRQLFNMWNMLFLLDPHECPPFGKPHDDCVRRKNEAAANGGGGSSSSGSGGSSTSSSSSSSNSGGGSGGSGGSSSSASSTSGSSSSSSSNQGFMSSRFSWLMLLAAAVAAALAIGAIMMGQGKQVKAAHPLQGSVGRRMGLFSNFADSSLCGNTDRPQRVVELTTSGEAGTDGAKYSGMV